MTTPVILVADKIVDLINSRTPGVASEDTERKYLPQYEVKNMGSKVYVAVVPSKEELEILSRGESQYFVEVDIGIQKKLMVDDGDDNVLILKKELEKLLLLNHFDDIGAENTGVESVALFSQEILLEKRVLISVLRAKYTVTVAE